MKRHYYFGWFNNTMPKNVGAMINQDLVSKESLVMISTVPSEHEYNDKFSKGVKESWFDFAGIHFEKYHCIDYRMTKGIAQELLRNASAILLHGGLPDSLKHFVEDYEMSKAIEESNATVVMGASAGGMNLSAKFAYKNEIYDGLCFDIFAFMPHAASSIEELKENDEIQALIPVSKEIPIYAGCEESVIRVKNGNIEILGDVYLVNNGEINKMPESGFKEENWICT